MFSKRMKTPVAQAEKAKITCSDWRDIRLYKSTGTITFSEMIEFCRLASLHGLETDDEIHIQGPGFSSGGISSTHTQFRATIKFVPEIDDENIPSTFDVVEKQLDNILGSERG